jgi:hypothetical protein
MIKVLTTDIFKDQRFFRINLLNFMVCLFLFRSSIPSFKYPFIAIYVYFIADFIFSKYPKILLLKKFFRQYYLILVLTVIFIFSILGSDKLYLEIFKDSINILILLSIMILYATTIVLKEDLDIMVVNFIEVIIWISLIISVLGLYEYFHVYYTNQVILQSDSSLVDYNFALLPVFFGMMSVMYKLPSINMKKRILLYNLVLFIYTLQVFFSSSRRGFIVISIIIVIIYISALFSLFYRRLYFKSFVKKIRIYLFTTTFFFFGLYFFVIHTSYNFKMSAFKYAGIQRINILQKDITEKCFRYWAMINKKTSYSSFYRDIWSPNSDPKDPDSGWGTRTHKTIFPLFGDSVQIVPQGVKGYMMDNTCNPYTSDGNAYSYTDLFFYNMNVNQDDEVAVSVYCYVSSDFNGDWALISLTNNNSGWIGSSFYNLEKKGTWQKLQFIRKCKEGEISSYLYFCKNGVTDFSSLKGYVIFAYPECKIIKTDKGLIKNDTIQSYRIFDKSVDSGKVNLSLFSCINEAGFMSSLFQIIQSPKQQDRDLVRRLASRFVSEDTTYHGYSTNILIDTIKNSFFDLRYVRWQFAIQIFTKEFSWRQKIFGGGFNFLNWYGFYFLKDRSKTDYPHNPFLYILLYSGIFGLLLYLTLLINVIIIYIRILKRYYIIFTFFIITFFFTFFSGGNPFDPPVMGFLVMLPFLIQSLFKNEQLNDTIAK